MGWRYSLLSCIGVLAANMASAEAPLHLKVRKEPASGDALAVTQVMPRRRTEARRHMILQFREFPRSTDKEELIRRGIKILGAVPESALMVSVPDEVGIEDLDLRWAGALPPESKVSPDIPAAASLTAGPGHYVVEFHADVDAHEADELVAERGLELHKHPDLLPNQRLVRGSIDQILRLVEWDEVDYVFPASQDLIEGRRVIACAGAQTEDGLIGQYIAKVGEGWDGPGQNAAELGYYFRSFSGKLDPEATRSEFARALAEWARYAQLTFTPASAAGLARTIDILFASGAHGDGYPFDGAGGVIAHTFYPAPPNSEPLAGDMHLDADEAWRVGADTDLYSVVLHELGHALGLGHSDRPGSVMYPYYRRATQLADEDIAAIRALYAEHTESSGGDSPQQPAPLKLTIQSPAGSPVTTTASSIFLSGIATGGAADPAITWISDRGYSGTAQGSRQWVIQAVPLSVGNNVITVTAAGGSSSPVSVSVFVIREAEVVAPSLAITSPTTAGTYSSASSSVVLSGTASHTSGIARVAWSNSRGGNGVAIGTTSWSTTPIALAAGSNTITVTAYEPGGQSASRQLVVDYAGAVQDTVAPTLRIISPSSTSVATTASAITIQGTATDNVGVDSVRWLTSTRKSGTAAGTGVWIIDNVPLYIGTNVVKIQAFDAAGNMSWRSLTITRQ